MTYAIVDIETTGAFSHYNAITEVGIIITDGYKILDQYETLIKPHENIPNFITALTGIDDEMVANAPNFENVAPKILEFTKGHIFVAHNVAFDYGFLRKAFKAYNFHFYRKKVCTVKLTKAVLPNLASYSLSKITHQLKLTHNNRHRAMGDALATFHLFKLLFNRGGEDYIKTALKKQSLNNKLPLNLPAKYFNALPEETGIYQFIDEKGKILYIGKAKNIKARIITHLNSKNKKQQRLQRAVYKLIFEVTGSELIAELLESQLIKQHLPPLNVAQRRNTTNYGIIGYEDMAGYQRLAISANCKKVAPLAWFTNLTSARNELAHICENFNLCAKLCGLQNVTKACFNYHQQKCKGACIQLETTKKYNNKVTKAIKTLQQQTISYLLFDKGKKADEQTFVAVSNGKYLGYGFIPKNVEINSLKNAQQYLQAKIDNRDVQRILAKHLNAAKLKIKVIS